MPENRTVLDMWLTIQTQWVVSTGGAVGLNYQSLESAMRMSQVPTADQPQLFADLRIIERAAMNAMSKTR